jgi:hypothetical protein
MGSRGERIAGLLGLGPVFLQVFYCGGSFYGCAVYRDLVLLYDIYLALVCARYMLALPSATPGMPYAVHVRALGMSTSGRSRSRVKPAVGSVRTQVALTARVPAPPTHATAPTVACVRTGSFFPDVVMMMVVVVVVVVMVMVAVVVMVMVVVTVFASPFVALMGWTGRFASWHYMCWWDSKGG